MEVIWTTKIVRYIYNEVTHGETNDCIWTEVDKFILDGLTVRDISGIYEGAEDFWMLNFKEDVDLDA